jgi:hypothetical protein
VGPRASVAVIRNRPTVRTARGYAHTVSAVFQHHRRALAAVVVAALVSPVVAWAVFLFQVAGDDSAPPTCFNVVGSEVACDAGLPWGRGALLFVSVLLVGTALVVVADIYVNRDRLHRTSGRDTTSTH